MGTLISDVHPASRPREINVCYLQTTRSASLGYKLRYKVANNKLRHKVASDHIGAFEKSNRKPVRPPGVNTLLVKSPASQVPGPPTGRCLGDLSSSRGDILQQTKLSNKNANQGGGISWPWRVPGAGGTVNLLPLETLRAVEAVKSSAHHLLLKTQN